MIHVLITGVLLNFSLATDLVLCFAQRNISWHSRKVYQHIQISYCVILTFLLIYTKGLERSSNNLLVLLLRYNNCVTDYKVKLHNVGVVIHVRYIMFESLMMVQSWFSSDGIFSLPK